MDHTVKNENYRFVIEGDNLLLEKLVETPHQKMRQWVNVLQGDVRHGDVSGHHDGFTVQEMRMFIDMVDVIQKGRQ